MQALSQLSYGPNKARDTRSAPGPLSTDRAPILSPAVEVADPGAFRCAFFCNAIVFIHLIQLVTELIENLTTIDSGPRTR